MLRIICLFAAIFTLLSAMSGGARGAADTTERWDCSGRLKVWLPGEFEVANVPYETLRKGIATFGEGGGFAFSDKEAADYA